MIVFSGVQKKLSSKRQDNLKERDQANDMEVPRYFPL